MALAIAPELIENGRRVLFARTFLVQMLQIAVTVRWGPSSQFAGVVGVCAPKLTLRARMGAPPWPLRL